MLRDLYSGYPNTGPFVQYSNGIFKNRCVRYSNSSECWTIFVRYSDGDNVQRFYCLKFEWYNTEQTFSGLLFKWCLVVIQMVSEWQTVCVQHSDGAISNQISDSQWSDIQNGLCLNPKTDPKRSDIVVCGMLFLFDSRNIPSSKVYCQMSPVGCGTTTKRP